MRSIDELSKTLNIWSEKVKTRLVEAQKETAKKVWEDVIDSAPMDSGTYISSIQISDTEVSNDKIKTSVFTDLAVGGENPKWAKIPLGALLEWGTGIKGATSNTYPHGYGYRLIPWVYYNKKYKMYITTDGMIARPHFVPSLHKNRATYLNEIKKAVKDK